MSAPDEERHDAVARLRRQRQDRETHAWGAGRDGRECIICAARWDDCDVGCAP